MSAEISMQPIGWVRSQITETVDDQWGGLVSTIELDETAYSLESLRGLDEFSHVQVLFYMHRAAPEKLLTGSKHPRERQDWPRVGIFAQRAKDRPNHIGLSTCRLVRVEGTRIWLAELDAIDGTPVLDIKPYMNEFGPRGVVKQPSWSEELMAGYFSA